jgi:hypothetical protein
MEGEPERAKLADDYPEWRIWRNGALIYGFVQPPEWGPLRLLAATVDGLRGQVEAVEAVRKDFPYWEVFEHVNGGRFYARRPGSSPPMVAGPVPLADLHAAIRAVEGERERRRGRMPE